MPAAKRKTHVGGAVHRLSDGVWQKGRSYVATTALSCRRCDAEVAPEERVTMTTGPQGYLCGICVPFHPRHAWRPWPGSKLRQSTEPVDGCGLCHDEALMLMSERTAAVRTGAAQRCPTCKGTGLVKPDA